ncbi:MAG: DegT/DnrJ/EryC1/StrS family aminotransferase [Deltaproteobacteria bacterium]|nr:DegT/DnrJ/EryC1/StrS family aminotransferase [Deltaproteobacteria bacterium]
MPGFEWFGDEERKEVQDVLDTGVLFRYGFDQARRGHWKARTFEEELTKRLGSCYAHLCSSGTSALSIALAACGVGAGDEVIVPPFTFVASVEALLAAGTIPVFAEIDETLCLDPRSVRAAITPRTRAVMPVHMCGAMARIDELKTICDEKKLVLIEDTCQSLGATHAGKSAGTFGHAGCFSFDPVKTVTCGEGGAVITSDQEIYFQAQAYADHGHDHIGPDRGLEAHPFLGMNYRISEMNAAVGLAQLRKLDAILATQRAHKRILKEALGQYPQVRFRVIPDEAGDSATFLSFFLEDEDQARRIAGSLGAAGMDGCFYWYDNNWHYLRKWDHFKQMKSLARLPFHLQETCPDYSKVFLPQSDRIMSRTLSLQIKLSWTPEALQKRVEIIESVMKEA